MSPLAYTILAYAIGLGLLWGYAATLYRSLRAVPSTPSEPDEQLGTGS